MSFGETVREILAASCGSDLRDASASAPLPELHSDAVLRTLAANLELAFGIHIANDDLRHFHTVRDVMQCVRLRAWERRTTAEAGAAVGTPARPARPVFVSTSRDPRERLLRYTPEVITALPFAVAAIDTK